jgi:glyoxylase-like metal-dependent hydrolase (beta-lactamase superfamily II)
MPQATPAIHRIRVPTPFRVGPVNCYLIDAGRLTLVDTGPRTDEALAALEAGVARTGARLEDVELVVLTHQHHDHVGLGAQVAGHPWLQPLLVDVEASLTEDDLFAVALMARYGVDSVDAEYLLAISAANRRYSASVEVDVGLCDDDLVDLGDTALRVLHRPGHSPTDIVLVEEASGRALVGDHMIRHISSNPVLHTPPPGSANGGHRPAPLPGYVASLERTRALDLSLVLSGHGDPIDDPQALVERRIAEHVRRSEHIAERIAAGSTTAPLLIRDIWPTLRRDQLFLALSEVLGHVDLLALDGRVVEVADDGTIRFELTN